MQCPVNNNYKIINYSISILVFGKGVKLIHVLSLQQYSGTPDAFYNFFKACNKAK